jgi:hypothetical protein
LTDSEIAVKLGIDIDIAESIIEIVEYSMDKGEQYDGNEKRDWC